MKSFPLRTIVFLVIRKRIILIILRRMVLVRVVRKFLAFVTRIMVRRILRRKSVKLDVLVILDLFTTEILKLPIIRLFVMMNRNGILHKLNRIMRIGDTLKKRTFVIWTLNIHTLSRRSVIPLLPLRSCRRVDVHFVRMIIRRYARNNVVCKRVRSFGFLDP